MSRGNQEWKSEEGEEKVCEEWKEWLLAGFIILNDHHFTSHCGGSVGRFRPCTLSCDTPTIITKYLLRIHLLSSIYLLLLYNLLYCAVPACECYECHLIFLQIRLTYDLMPCLFKRWLKIKWNVKWGWIIDLIIPGWILPCLKLVVSSCTKTLSMMM